jgi:hypothetical protein
MHYILCSIYHYNTDKEGGIQARVVLVIFKEKNENPLLLPQKEKIGILKNIQHKKIKINHKN